MAAKRVKLYGPAARSAQAVIDATNNKCLTTRQRGQLIARHIDTLADKRIPVEVYRQCGLPDRVLNAIEKVRQRHAGVPV